MKYLKTFENHFNILTRVKEILTYELESNDYTVSDISLSFASNTSTDDIAFRIDLSYEESDIRHLFDLYNIATHDYDCADLLGTSGGENINDLKTKYEVSKKELETKLFEYTYKIFKRLEAKHDWDIVTFRATILNAESYEGGIYATIVSHMDKKVNETGEWVGDEDQVSWMELLKEQVEVIADLCPDGTVELIEVKGFDNYAGPYANTYIFGKKYKIWTTETGLWIDGYSNPDNTSQNGQKRGYEGSPYQIANVINAYIKAQQLLAEELDYLSSSSEVSYTHDKLGDNDSTFIYQYFVDINEIPELEKILDRFIKKWDMNSYKIDKVSNGLVFINLYIDELSNWINNYVND